MLGNSNSGLTDTNSDRLLKYIQHLLNESPDEWFGSDKNLYVALGDKKWVAKDNGKDSYTVILNVPRSVLSGPGYRIRVIDLDEMKEYFLSDDFNAEIYGIKDKEVFWAHEDTIVQLGIYIQDNPELYHADGFYDKAWDGKYLIETLCDIYDMEEENYLP